MADGSATVSIFPNVPVDVSVTTNAPRTRRATIVIDGNMSGPFTGSGERNLIGRDSTNSGSGNVQVMLEYDSGGGSWVGLQNQYRWTLYDGIVGLHDCGGRKRG